MTRLIYDIKGIWRGELQPSLVQFVNVETRA